MICGEMAESAEGGRLLSDCTGKYLYRGFESLSLRHLCAPVAQVDRAPDYGSGCGGSSPPGRTILIFRRKTILEF
jgi:hypothetical protein